MRKRLIKLLILGAVTCTYFVTMHLSYLRGMNEGIASGVSSTTERLTMEHSAEVQELTTEFETEQEELIEEYEQKIVDINAANEAALETRVAAIKKEYINYHVGNFQLTAYAPYENVDGLDNDGDPSTTSIGLTPGHNVFAVDPTVIPYYSNMVIIYPNGEVRTGIAGDCGGAIKGNRIDVYVDTHEQAINHGIRDAVVIWWE